MLRFVTSRLAQAVVVMLGVTAIAFVLEHLVASGPTLARTIIGPHATRPAIEAFITRYGLNQPLPVQYLHFITQLFHGNLGYSYKQNATVDSILAEQAPKDLVLVGTALVVALAIAVPLGILQASRRDTIWDHMLTGVSFLAYSMPTYWLALLLIAWFSVALNWFPSEAPQGASLGTILSDPAGLVLPVLSLTVVYVALFSRYMRASAIEQLMQDHMRTARAKGMSEPGLLRRHVLRNSLLPVITLVGLSLPGLLTAGLVVEYVFNFPGIGLSFFNAAQASDYPVVTAITLIVGLLTVMGNLIADVCYAVLDPRIR